MLGLASTTIGCGKEGSKSPTDSSAPESCKETADGTAESCDDPSTEPGEDPVTNTDLTTNGYALLNLPEGYTDGVLVSISAIEGAGYILSGNFANGANNVNDSNGGGWFLVKVDSGGKVVSSFNNGAPLTVPVIPEADS